MSSLHPEGTGQAGAHCNAPAPLRPPQWIPPWNFWIFAATATAAATSAASSTIDACRPSSYNEVLQRCRKDWYHVASPLQINHD